MQFQISFLQNSSIIVVDSVYIFPVSKNRVFSADNIRLPNVTVDVLPKFLANDVDYANCQVIHWFCAAWVFP